MNRLGGMLMGGMLFLAGRAVAADGTVVQQVEAKYAKVQVLQADFTQRTSSTSFGEEIQQGDVVLKRPRKMRWNFTSGEQRQFVTDGQVMWVYSTADNQVIRYDDISGAASTADSLLQSLDRLDELFTVEVQPADGGGHQLDLVPRKEAQQVKSLQLFLNASLVLDRVVIRDPYDNLTELAFKNVRLDTDVPDSVFQFQVPPGAEVISAGGM